MNPSSYLWKNLREQNATGSNLVLRACRSAGKGLYALWSLGESGKIPAVSITGKGGLCAPYLPFSSTVTPTYVSWAQEVFHGKVLHRNGSVQKLSVPREKTGISYSGISCLVICFQEMIPEIPTLVDLHEKQNCRILLLFINKLCIIFWLHSCHQRSQLKKSPNTSCEPYNFKSAYLFFPPIWLFRYSILLSQSKERWVFIFYNEINLSREKE